MPWIDPKTDWTATDTFEVNPDYVRITGNIRELLARARPIVGDLSTKPMAAWNTASLPYVDEMQAVEDNTQAVRDAIPAATKLPHKRTLEENGRAWDFEDLNRLERNALQLDEYINNAAGNRPTLAFTLGGGVFAQGI